MMLSENPANCPRGRRERFLQNRFDLPSCDGDAALGQIYVWTGAAARSGRLTGGPLLGALELVEAEHGELAGDHPRQSMHGMGDPFLIGHYRDSLEGRMMGQHIAKAEL